MEASSSPETRGAIATAAKFITVPRSHVRPSPTNPRKHIDPKALDDLAASIREKGILSPLLVRPDPQTGAGYYEVVFGERRLRAAAKAGLDELVVRVADLNDAEVAEAQVIENGQREDVHPLEEADGYRLLHEKHKISVPDIAIKVGKSDGYVYARLKLAQLDDKEAREAFFAGEIGPEIALMIARLPKQLQGQALAGVRKLPGEYVVDHAGKQRVGPPSAAIARQFLRENFTLRLDTAPFDINDATLVPAAGACGTCPKRTGNQAALFEGEPKDVCTDPACFKSKRKAWQDIALLKAEDMGLKILPPAEAKKLWPYSNSDEQTTYGAAYVNVDCRSHESPFHSRGIRDVLKKHTPGLSAVAIHPHTGNLIQLATKEALKKAIRAAGIKSSSGSSGGHSSPPRSSAKDRAERLARESKQNELQVRALTVARAAIDQLRAALRAKGADLRPALRIAIAALDPEGVISDTLAALSGGKHGQTGQRGYAYGDLGELDPQLLKSLERSSIEDMVALLAVSTLSVYGSSDLTDELAWNSPIGLSAVLYGGKYSRTLTALAAAYRIDLKKIEKQVTAERVKLAAAGKTEKAEVPPKTAMEAALRKAKAVKSKKAR